MAAGSTLPTVGLIGVGHLGKPLAYNLLGANYPLVVHSRSRAEADDVVARGATWAASSADVGAAADVVITVLPWPHVVREVMIGSGGVLERMRPGTTHIDMSTSSVEVAHEIMALAGPRGVAVMDAPVSFIAKAPLGESRRTATLQIFVGGTAEDFARHLPLFRALGGLEQQIVHAGLNGAGYAIKVLLNLLWFMHAAGTSEVLVMATKLGVDLRTLQRVLCTSAAQSNFLQYDVNGVLERGDYDEGFTIELVCKDLGLALGLGARTGVDVPVSRLVEQLHRRALEAYGPNAGEMSVVKLYEDAAGLQLRAPAP
jgi:3-hydroxyisobutyrate dehydrogenase